MSVCLTWIEGNPGRTVEHNFVPPDSAVADDPLSIHRLPILRIHINDKHQTRMEMVPASACLAK